MLRFGHGRGHENECAGRQAGRLTASASGEHTKVSHLARLLVALGSLAQLSRFPRWAGWQPGLAREL